MVLKTEEVLLNMGPQHPSTHGVLRLILSIDQENVRSADADIGYLHRGIEKLAETMTYPQLVPLTDRLDYIASVLNNHGACLAMEKLGQIEVPLRASYLRVLSSELGRIANHLLYIACFGMDVGAVTMLIYGLRERELVLDLFEMLCGARLTHNYICLGGVRHDIPDGFIGKCRAFLDFMPSMLKEYRELLVGNRIFRQRTRDICRISPETALDIGLTGPSLRASGVNWDLRKAEPYSAYDHFDFEVPLGKRGDVFDRFHMRFLEVEQSLKIIRQVIDKLPEGPVRGKVSKVFKPPVGEVYVQIEAAKGALGYYLISDGSAKPYRVKIRVPSFSNLSHINMMMKGWLIADAIAILACLDLVLGESDK